MAEENNLIDDLTDVVYVKAMKQAKQWLDQGDKFKVAVNLSIDSLNRLDLTDFLINTAMEQGVDPSQVVIEVTESRFMEDIKGPLETLTRLRLKGALLSIDDFGTGYSSMEQLKRIPFTELKIDRAFVYRAWENKEARAILESSVSLAKSLNLMTVAEGVEDQADWDLIESLGVDIVQGYFVAKPMPAREFDDWLDMWMKSLATS